MCTSHDLEPHYCSTTFVANKLVARLLACFICIRCWLNSARLPRRIPVARQALPRVHGGFWEAYSKLREKVLAALAVELQVRWKDTTRRRSKIKIDTQIHIYHCFITFRMDVYCSTPRLIQSSTGEVIGVLTISYCVTVF